MDGGATFSSSSSSSSSFYFYDSFKRLFNPEEEETLFVRLASREIGT